MLKPKLAPPRPDILVDILDAPEVLDGGDQNGFAVNAEDRPKKGRGKKGTGQAKSSDWKPKETENGSSWSSGKTWDKQADWKGKHKADWNTDSQADWKKSKSWQDSSWNASSSHGKGKAKGEGKGKGKGGKSDRENRRGGCSASFERPADDKEVKPGPRGKWRVGEMWASAPVRSSMSEDARRIGSGKASGTIVNGFDQGDWIMLEGEEGFIRKKMFGSDVLELIEGGLPPSASPVAQQVAGQSLCRQDDFGPGERARATQSMSMPTVQPTTPQQLLPARPAEPAVTVAAGRIGWMRKESRSSPGSFYYYNDQTGESQPEPPAPWIKKESRSQPGAFYYYNPNTGVSSGDKPAL